MGAEDIIAGRHPEASIGKFFYIRYAGVEMILAAMLLDAAAYVFHHFRQFVSADMRMSVNEYVFVGAESHKLVQDLPDIAPFG